MSTLNDPKHWQERAKEARHVADQLNDPLARQTMLEIALSYDGLAIRAEARAAQKVSN